jgi:MFS family permease
MSERNVVGSSAQESELTFWPGVILLSSIILPTMGTMLIVPVLPKIGEHFGDVPNIQFLVPILLTAPALMISVLSMGAGYIADRLGRRRVFIAAMFVYAVFGVLPLVLDSIHAIIASRFLVGIAESVIMTVTVTLIGDYYSGRRRDAYISAQAAVSGIGALVILAIGGLLGEGGWRTPFAAYGLGLVIAVASAVALPEPQPRKEEVLHHQQHTDGFPWGMMGLVSPFTLICGILFFIVPTQSPALLTAAGVTSPLSIGLFTALFTAFIVVGNLASYVTRFLGPRTIFAAALALMAAGLLIAALSSGLPQLLVGLCVASLGGGISFPTMLTWMMSRLEFYHRGRGTGLWNSSFFLGQFISPLAVVSLAQTSGGTPKALLIMAAFAIVSVLLWLMLAPRSVQPLVRAEAH